MCYAAVMRSSLYGFSITSWKRSLSIAGIRVVSFDSLLTKFRVQCYSAARRSRASPKSAPKVKVVPKPPPMEDESNAFYVVRKGDIVGIYKNLNDCQGQVASSVSDPAVSVYKGYSLRKEAEEYLASNGLKNSIYSIRSADVKEDLFGTLVPCPFKQPDAPVSSEKMSAQKRLNEVVEFESSVVEIESSISTDPSHKHLKLGYSVGAHEISSGPTCLLEFDGASKGNPGKGGAGAILRNQDGSVVCRVREGLGTVTNNVAEYRAMILGMKCAIKKGFKNIRVQGDSKLVCMQVQNLWQVKHQNMIELCKEVKGLKDKFISFQISHVLRELNSEADAQANLATALEDGQVYECGPYD